MSGVITRGLSWLLPDMLGAGWCCFIAAVVVLPAWMACFSYSELERGIRMARAAGLVFEVEETIHSCIYSRCVKCNFRRLAYCGPVSAEALASTVRISRSIESHLCDCKTCRGYIWFDPTVRGGGIK